MTDTETVEFKLMLSADWWDEQPYYEILVNDDMIETGRVEELLKENKFKILQFKRDLPEGDHVLKVRLLKKTMKQTSVDEEGNILNDQLLHIKQIEIDEIELDFLVWQKSFFHHLISYENNSNPVFNSTPDDNKYPTMGFNGEYRLNFSVPTYMWFLENL